MLKILTFQDAMNWLIEKNSQKIFEPQNET